MHMADALLSVPVALTMAAASATALAWAAQRVARRGAEHMPALGGVLAAFVFALQMVNFAIPGTGASGHLGGGLLLAVLLGPAAALLAIASVLTVQALVFADGGLLALGANIFNLGVLPCLVVYPLLYRPLAGRAPSARRMALAAWVSALVALLLGALAVVLQTQASGISSLPASTFAWLMLPVHGAIGIGEGLATAALLLFLHRHAPELLPAARMRGPAAAPRRGLRHALVATALTGGVLAWFASPLPDGLEWSVARAAGAQGVPEPAQGLHPWLHQVQQRVAVLPDYALPGKAHDAEAQADPTWPAPAAETSLAGIAGAGLTLLLLAGIGWLLRRRGP